MTWCIFASDKSDVKLFHKVRRVAVLTYTANGSNRQKYYEDIILQLKPYTCYFIIMSAMKLL